MVVLKSKQTGVVGIISIILYVYMYLVHPYACNDVFIQAYILEIYMIQAYTLYIRSYWQINNCKRRDVPTMS